MSFRKPLLIIAILFSIRTYSQNTGTINGFVKNSATQLPVEGAIITIENTGYSAYSDSNGFYKISGIIPKSYNIKASLIGYISATQYDIVVTSGNENNVNFFLSAEEKELQGTTIKGKIFRKQTETPLSVHSLSSQEVKSFPGANFDIVKVAQSLPGVSGSVGFRNDLIIRGGAPNETVYYLDGIEVPNINHFATQGSGGGPVGMLNVSFIDEVSLSTSAFNAKYDNPLSGVLQFRQKTGNVNKTQGNFRLGASEAALTLEGPLSKNKKWTYMASVRRSYLQFLFKLINLPFLPNYWDYQYKITFKPNKKNEISLIGLNAIDDFYFNPPKVDATKDDNTIQNSLYILNFIPKNTQYSATAGITWKHIVKNGYWNLAVSSNVLRNSAIKYTDNDEGNIAKLRLNLKSYEWENKLRWDMNQFKGKWKFSYGGNITLSNYSNNLYSKVYVQLLDSLIPFTFQSKILFAKFGAFANVNRSLLSNRLNVSFGIRTDMNTFLNDGLNPLKTLAPRFNATYAFTSKFNINFSVGKYYKIPPYTVLGYKNSDGIFANKNNSYIGSTHFTIGVEFLTGKAGRLTIEGFYKIYSNYPVSNKDSISLANLGGNFGYIGNEAISSNGLGKTYGLEFSYQQKLTKNFYGILSYTFYYSKFTGFDTKKYIPSAWDNRHLITFTGGYKFKHNWEVGLRFRFLGSAPYTPFDTMASLNAYLNTGEGVLNYRKFNTLSFSTYSAFDLRIDKKWNFKKWTLDIFLDLQNLTGVANPSQPSFTYKRDVANPQNFIDKQGNSIPVSKVNPMNMQYIVLQNNSGSLIPSIGVVVEF